MTFALKLFISAVVLGLVLSKVNFADLIRRFGNIRLWPLALALTCYFASVMFSALRWRILSGERISLWLAVKYTFIGIMYGFALPGVLAGDVAKGAVMAVSEPHLRRVELPISIFMDRLAGVFSLVVICIPACIAGLFMFDGAAIIFRQYWVLLWSSVLFVMAMMLAYLWRSDLRLYILARKNLLPSRCAMQVAGILSVNEASNLSIYRILGLCFVVHFLNICQTLCILHAIDVPIGFGASVVLYAVISVIVMLPISVMGVGVRDSYCYFFFLALGYDPSLGVFYSMAILSLNLVGVLSGVVLHLWSSFASVRVRET